MFTGNSSSRFVEAAKVEAGAKNNPIVDYTALNYPANDVKQDISRGCRFIEFEEKAAISRMAMWVLKLKFQRQRLKVPADLLFLLTIQVEKPLVIQLRMTGSDITIENGEQLIDKVGDGMSAFDEQNIATEVRKLSFCIAMFPKPAENNREGSGLGLTRGMEDTVSRGSVIRLMKLVEVDELKAMTMGFLDIGHLIREDEVERGACIVVPVNYYSKWGRREWMGL
ncbi:hypothetical protein D5086_024832 [Populus alba]|uniref:Uncharacterized protein n=1 Tax=Populus alba TaxID=43335 RepID=A0ACC4B730_POPAL